MSANYAKSAKVLKFFVTEVYLSRFQLKRSIGTKPHITQSTDESMGEPSNFKKHIKIVRRNDGPIRTLTYSLR